MFNNEKSDIEDFKFQLNINSAFFIFNSAAFYVSLFESHINSEDGYLLLYVYPVFSVLIVIQNFLLSRAIWNLKKN